MKAIASWLSDPFLHLIGVGALVLAIGMGLSSGDSGKRDAAAKPAPRCVECMKSHPASRTCYDAITYATAR